VGAGLGGWRLAEGLRREGFDGDVSMLGAEDRVPYDRPPLSKQVMTGKWPVERAELATIDRLGELGIEARLGDPAVAIELADNTVHTRSGAQHRADEVVIACGAAPRRLGFSAGAATHVLRSMDDAEALLEAVSVLAAGTRVIVIGGGFIGAELATSLVTRGLDALVLEVAARPLLGVLGARASGWLDGLAGAFGVELLADQGVLDVTGERGDLRVELASGDALSAPVVIEAVGAQVRTDWLEGSGLALEDGVRVDEHLRAATGVRALGDVARFTWRHGPFEEVVRVEHWQAAIDHATYLAAAITAGDDDVAPAMDVPYFWSDQYGKKIQVLGRPWPSDEVEMVTGSPEEGRFVALFSRAGTVTGAIGLSAPRALMLCRGAVESHQGLDAALGERAWDG
jgi:NADPH-dependent 2,4-dienoyl-CoA reductase/sulfur reductase-like enzyme